MLGIKNTQKNKKYISHLKSYEKEYMQGVDRSKDRIKATQEIFTPYEAVKYYVDQLDKLDNFKSFNDITHPIIDNCIGDGVWVGYCLIRRLQNGFDLAECLKTIYGCDIEPTNIKRCHERLACGVQEVMPILQKNIVVSDALATEYRFDNTDPSRTSQEIHTDNILRIFTEEKPAK